MKRRSFLTMLGGLLASSVVDAKKNEKKEIYSFNEIFYRPYEGNQSLIYVKDNSILADKIYATEKVDKNFKSDYESGIYFPVRQIYIEFKDEYNEQDFAPIIFYLKNKDGYSWKFVPFMNHILGRSPMRFILNKEGYMQAEFLSKNNY